MSLLGGASQYRPPCWASIAQIQRILLIVTHWFKNWFCYRDTIFTSMGRYRDPPLPIQTTMQSKYSGTSTLRHLFSRETSIHGTQNLVLEKCSHINLCTCYPYLFMKGHFCSRKSDTFPTSPNLGLTSIQVQWNTALWPLHYYGQFFLA